ncbi:MAG: peptidoglycan-binding protein [Muribaculaceae bacterium]|nr:peptidoglycan-binding protein [Muribaculaceae bacterium]
MKNKSKKIIRTLLLSATVALLHGSAKADSKKTLSLDLDLGLGNGNASPEVSKSPQPIVKNLYKILRSGDVKLIAGHRSHSSHRSSRSGHYSHSSSSSHRSHSSHRSSGGGSHYSHSSSTYGSGSRSSVYTPPPKTAGDYSLGDRTLSTGIHGSDVDQLVPYLVRYYYLKDGIVSKKGGYYVYDSNVVNAVKHFQKDAGLTQDGKLTASAVSALKSWSASRTTIPLGFRELSAAAETSGFDVDELVQLLINAGYSPDPAKLKKSGSHYVFTDDILTAIKMFQAYNGIQPNGELNSATLSKLKTFKK